MLIAVLSTVLFLVAIVAVAVGMVLIRRIRIAERRAERSEAQVADLRAAMEQMHAATRVHAANQLAMFDRINHDVRVPISALLGLTEILEGDRLSGEQRELAADIRHCGLRAIERLADLCVLVDPPQSVGPLAAGFVPSDAVRSSASGPEVWTEFSARELVEQVVDLVRSDRRGTGLTIRLHIDDGIGERYQADIFRIRGILSHLLADAAERTRVGNVELSVTGTAEQLTFTLRDSGAPRAPDSFALDLASRLALQLGTQLQLSQTPGIGGKAAFSARCHLIAGARPRSESESQSAEAPTPPMLAAMRALYDEQLPQLQPSDDEVPATIASGCDGLRVLVVDDDPTSRKTIGRLLQRGGAVVERAADGKSALARLREDWSRFDALVCDVVMPGQTGLEVAREIRIEQLSFPIVLLSSAVSASVRTAAAELHIDALLARPVSSSSLLDTLQRSVANRAQSFRESASGHRVLVVDDNAINRRIAAESLSRRGYDVSVACDGAQGVQMYADGNYDIILMDCRMPVMDGLQATREIRSLEAPGTAIPIIAVTASPHPGDREKCRQAGMTDYVLKPVDFAALAALMARQLDVAVAPDTTERSERRDSNADGNSNRLVDDEMIARVLEEPEDVEFIESLAEDIFNTVERWIPEMRDALNSDDRELFVRRAHDLKSMTATLGLTQFSTLYQTLEMSGEVEQPDVLLALLDEAHAAAPANREAAIAVIARLSSELWAGHAA